MKTMRATMTSKGQITIPQAIRRKLKLHAGSVLEFDEVADHLKATKCADPARMRSVIGIAKKNLAGKSTLEWLDELRGPVEMPVRKRK
jgi:AbrB family looped-hinge helix DNA binding protein